MRRVAVIGIGHWHQQLYLEPLTKLADVTIVGVSDPEAAVAARWAGQLGTVADTDYRSLCDKVKPDFVFALGRHCDMAAEAEYLMRSDIPFAMEKPCGRDYAEVRALAGLQAELGAFAAIPFTWRQTGLAATLRAQFSEGKLSYLLFRRLLGLPERYITAGCSWMLDPAQAGGGCTMNLGVHWIDLFQWLTGDRDTEVVSALLASSRWKLPVEDYSLLVLKSGDSYCVTDTGYVYPGGQLDLHHSVVGTDSYLIADAAGHGSVSDFHGSAEPLEIPVAPDYGRFVAEVLDQAARGQQPIATMQDMAAVMKVVDRAYRLAGRL
jgi:predicted dehydrogenase